MVPPRNPQPIDDDQPPGRRRRYQLHGRKISRRCIGLCRSVGTRREYLPLDFAHRAAEFMGAAVAVIRKIESAIQAIA